MNFVCSLSAIWAQDLVEEEGEEEEEEEKYLVEEEDIIEETGYMDEVLDKEHEESEANEKRDGLFPLEPSFRRDLYHRGILLGLDGSIVNDGMMVYVPDWMSMELPRPMQEIDYFHGMLNGHAMCQTTEDEVGLYDINMLNPDVGFVAFKIRKIQRLFRQVKRRVQNHDEENEVL